MCSSTSLPTAWRPPRVLTITLLRLWPAPSRMKPATSSAASPASSRACSEEGRRRCRRQLREIRRMHKMPSRRRRRGCLAKLQASSKRTSRQVPHPSRPTLLSRPRSDEQQLRCAADFAADFGGTASYETASLHTSVGMDRQRRRGHQELQNLPPRPHHYIRGQAAAAGLERSRFPRRSLAL